MPDSRNPLQDADKLVDVDRRDAYGHPAIDYTCTGRLWAALLTGFAVKNGLLAEGQQFPDIPPELACLMMDAVKSSRLSRNLLHYDSWVDKAGYTKCGWLSVEYSRDSTSKESPTNTTFYTPVLKRTTVSKEWQPAIDVSEYVR